jgi:hypothetical protein
MELKMKDRFCEEVSTVGRGRGMEGVKDGEYG